MHGAFRKKYTLIRRMKVKFWGTQGSLPASVTAAQVRGKIYDALMLARDENLKSPQDIEHFIDTRLPFSVSGSYGTNTTCLQVMNELGPHIICDCGSGLRDLGMHLAKTGRAQAPSTYHIFITHLHWDHIQGFPFFAPAFIPGNQIIIHSYHEAVEDAFRKQMEPPCFPVPFDLTAAEIHFDIQPPLTPYVIDGFQITTIEQIHPGISYGYRFEKDGKSIVFSTDSEHKKEAYDEHYPFLKFIEDTDLLIFDAQYSMAEATFSKADWGHSSNVMGVELATRGRVKRLAICHHEPTSTDQGLDDFLHNTLLYQEIYHDEVRQTLPGPLMPEKILLAYDGLEIEV